MNVRKKPLVPGNPGGDLASRSPALASGPARTDAWRLGYGTAATGAPDDVLRRVAQHQMADFYDGVDQFRREHHMNRLLKAPPDGGGTMPIGFHKFGSWFVEFGGKSLWSPVQTRTKVRVTELVVIQDDLDRTKPHFLFALFDPATWDPATMGLLYTDERFEADLNRLLKQLAAGVQVVWSEHGTQSDWSLFPHEHYAHFDAFELKPRRSPI